VQNQKAAGMLSGMNTVLASGVQAFANATSRLNDAAGQIARVRTSTIPAALSPSALAPDAAAGDPVAPPPSAGTGGRVFSADANFAEAQIQMILARHEAAVASTSIRAASDMVGEVLDMKT